MSIEQRITLGHAPKRNLSLWLYNEGHMQWHMSDCELPYITAYNYYTTAQFLEVEVTCMLLLKEQPPVVTDCLLVKYKYTKSTG